MSLNNEISTSGHTSLFTPIRTLSRGLSDAILPQTCAVCGGWIPAGQGMTCPTCCAELTAIRAVSYCGRCGRTMPRVALDERGCARCRHERYWNVAGIVRIGAYPPALRHLVTGLKYAGHERNADLTAELLSDALVQCGWLDHLDGLVPVPMHWLRRWQRPCDHTELLAAALARRTGLAVLRAMRRIRHTPSQTRALSQSQRFQNVKGCFALRGGHRALVAGKRVCIVDNLLATGATICEVSKVLRRAGAKRIYAAVISRTVLSGDTQASSDSMLTEPNRLEIGD